MALQKLQTTRKSQCRGKYDASHFLAPPPSETRTVLFQGFYIEIIFNPPTKESISPK
jgi:hypothetical protein